MTPHFAAMHTRYTATTPRECTVAVTRADAADARFALAEEVDAMREFGWTVIGKPRCVSTANGWSAVAHMRREE